MRKLTIQNCYLGNEAMSAIGKGLYKNNTLSFLNLS